MANNSPQEWFHSLPKLTQSYLACCFLSTCITTLGIVTPFHLHLDWNMIFQKVHLHRLLTCFTFIGGFSFPFVMKLFILVQYSTKLEQNPFPAGGGSTADYAFMLLFGAISLMGIGTLMGFPFLASSLIFLIVYVWSRREPDAPISFWGFKFKALYLPWAFMAFTVLVGGSPIGDLLGVIAGHLYYFVIHVYPEKNGKALLQTPPFLQNLFPVPRVVYTQSGAKTVQPNVKPKTYQWGSGRSLGS